MIDKQYENELLHEIDHLQRQVKELEEENMRLRSSTPLLAEIKLDTEEIYNRVVKDIEECKKLLDFYVQAFPVLNNQCALYKKALELACTELSESQTESHYPFNWVCDSEDFICDRRCEHKSGKFKGTLAYDDKDCWKSFFLQKAGEEE